VEHSGISVAQHVCTCAVHTRTNMHARTHARTHTRTRTLGRQPWTLGQRARLGIWRRRRPLQTANGVARDPVALNLIYVEAREAIRTKVVAVTDEAKAELKTHQASGDKRSFVECCQALKGPSPCLTHRDFVFFLQPRLPHCEPPSSLPFRRRDLFHFRRYALPFDPRPLSFSSQASSAFPLTYWDNGVL
jgi:hypothetical protein